VLKAAAGFAPLMGLAVCSGAFLPRRTAIAFGLAAVLVPQFFIHRLTGSPFWGSFLAVQIVSAAVAVALGSAVRAKSSAVPVLAASALSTVLFYLLSNTVSFFSAPGYPPSLAGWWQCLTTGLPEFSPQTWVFGLRQLVGDTSFAALFWLLCHSHERKASPAPGMTPATLP
jgi:hypothetical protein